MDTIVCGRVELKLTQIGSRRTYMARVGDSGPYVLVEAPSSGYDPVDRWAVYDKGEPGTFLEDEVTVSALDRAAVLADVIRPSPPVARISRELPLAPASDLSDDDFNRLGDEVELCCPGLSTDVVYERAVQLKALEVQPPTS